MNKSVSSFLLISLLGMSMTACQSPSVSINVTAKESEAAPSPKKSPSDQPANTESVSPRQSQRSAARPTSPQPTVKESVLEQPLNAVLTSADPDSRINIRSGPSTSTQALHYGVNGDRVTLLKVSSTPRESWFYVRFEASKATGWVREDFVTQQSPELETQDYVGDLPRAAELYRKNPNEQISIYSSASFDSQVKHYGLSQDQVTILNIILEEDGYWYFIRFNQSGAKGWVHDSDFLPV